MSLPTSARLGPFEFRITDDPDEWEISEIDPAKHFGYTDLARAVIIVHSNTPVAMQRVVVLHELMHAAAFCAGQLDGRKRTEEAWVVMTTPMLLDALQRSPGVRSFLFDERPSEAGAA